ncbi:alpha/beta hydrolase [Mammaliicoccus sciuri]|uniref:alpha/beta hydrolase n=1 Tax=Mammaliicoccus sciuri TaxID=1296 RepID=UPI00311FB0E5
MSVIASNDRLVPRHLSERLAEKLQSQEVIVEHEGHFCDSDGYTEFPEVAEIVNDMFNK